MNMYKITNVTDRNGNVKHDFIKEIEDRHPDLIGEIINKDTLNSDLFLCGLRFVWADEPDRMLHTSTVLDYVEDSNKIVATTRNSVYTFEKVR